MLRGVSSIPRPKVYGQIRSSYKPTFARSQPLRFSTFNFNTRRFFVSHKDENDITKIPMSQAVEGLTHRAAIPPAAVTQITGMPVDALYKRKAVVYKPSRNAMQQGTHKTKKWRVEWEQEPKIDSPLMGWMGSRDSLACVRLDFDTLDAAIHHLESNGYPYEVKEETAAPVRKNDVKSYSDNFAYVPARPSEAKWAEFEEEIEKHKY